MSTPLAVAAVTAVLKNFLENSLVEISSALGGNITISAQPPDRIDIDQRAFDRINLFLFQATENAAWRNTSLASRSPNGDRISNPALALDLSYLVTAYGSADLHAEALLGYAMFVFHEMPVLTRDAIRALTLTPADPPLLAGLTNSELADQIEQIRITPQTMSVEELSKIWSALQSQYRPTAVYHVSVVLIEADKSVRPTLPVRARNLLVLPFENPAIEQLQSQAAANQPIVPDQAILAGYNLVIDGQRLRGEITRVLIDDEEITPNDDQITSNRIIVALPADLQPGLHSVQVAHRVAFDPINAPNDTRQGEESNVAAFVLSPRITTAAPINAARNSTLSLGISPPVGRGQRAALLAGNNTISIPSRPLSPEKTATLDFPIPKDFPTGTQLLRVQIDGAESPLAVDNSGKFVSPTVTIT